ncbi:UvrD-helicase domain-containing protein [Actinorugispora endophytica]|uniref:DNA 3'-5' helicase n=1 Tax=Actinorugispora endophytica TaxID=1605990 RepID=A0A4R6V7E2_9ACTN|nr:UvrD-helicase domain-containing protein [Actinorugispora endophytica]TDQ54447.1 UvrD-like helicase family protein [Actinorugispora endophytica]
MSVETRTQGGQNPRQDEAYRAQREVVDTDVRPGVPLLVRACPGAGKTRVIVERHLTRPLPPRKGRAIVSFTKVAGRELRRRCQEQGLPESAGFPNFIGTLDTFFWLHLVRPYLGTLPEEGRTWRRLESWWDHPKGREKEYGDHPDLAGKGYLTGDQVRKLARRLLAEEGTGSRITGFLTARFDELIVDEAQDCSNEDLGILATLGERGLPLVLVEDPDQRIYGFREKGALREVPPLLRSAPVMRLRHNWRSSQTICDLAATLRTSGGSRPDTATGQHQDDGTPITLIPLPEQGVDHVRAFCAEAGKLGIRQSERLVVAYAGASLPVELAGASCLPESPFGRMAWAVGVLRAPVAPRRQREKARRIIRENILDVWYGADERLEEERREKHGVTGEGLTRATALVLRDLPSLDEPAEKWRIGAREAFERYRPGPGLSSPVGVPDWSGAWWERDARPAREVGGHGVAALASQVEVGRVTTIHQAKGGEADAVLIVVPKRGKQGDSSAKTIRQWLARTPVKGKDEEARNVLYVAATRARRLLAFAMGEEQVRLVEAFLEERGIPCRVLP